MTFRCRQCVLQFTHQYMLIMHQYSHKSVPKPSHEDPNNFMCELCELHFINQDHLQNHVAQHIQTQKFVYGVCHKSFKTETRYIHHMSDNTVHFNDFKCSMCSKKLSSKKHLVNHIKLHTSETTFSCATCKKSFVNKNKLDTHEKMHSPDFRCSICDKAFSSKFGIWNRNGAGIFRCTECPKKYLKQGHLNCHLLTHYPSNVEEQKCIFRCSECDKSFRTKGNLNFHKRSHMNRSD